jgi:two-component sensor histidine kinase
MKRLLLVNLSHDVRTPLNAVLNYLELAMEQPLDKKTRDMLHMSYTASKSLIFVIDELLHLTGGKSEPAAMLVEVTFDLPRTLRRTLALLKEHASRKGLTFEIEEDPDLPRFIRGDPLRLEQVVTNLVVNAIQYTEIGGVVVRLGTVSRTEEMCTIGIEVQDTGKGMTDRDLDNIFQEFEQVSDSDLDQETPKEEETGAVAPPSNQDEVHMGLGLAQVARYTKQTGGQIRGSSQPGAGTIFVLEVPMKLSSNPRGSQDSPSSGPSRATTPDFVTPWSTVPSTRRPSVTPQPAPHSPTADEPTPMGFHQELVSSTPNKLPTAIEIVESRGFSVPSSVPAFQPLPPEETEARGTRRVIVADDNIVNCKILARRLNKFGYEVKVCRDGQQCVETYIQDRDGFDFVLMDINVGTLSIEPVQHILYQVC